ncbi:uncharacterized protein MELLADRAFT_94453 [Melampsora larici-populina 98AG31]|uniref:CxC5 like cysteine cluster associated with KDZ domain-containing protein n=1 Tax=Melampsora larici-populina (strain 98AG31 / pathotype 3-4-7) TaxID=747676 RepID=F4RB24_MELLP|nr:uncharacterized protein MELLADRAFT_94453 [Melampsora larici-populina 98AG31]EGG10338.1 hypothetical protein MELLADRAFT_94453 [Melampsora larici-populina 98AG31]
MSNESSHTEDLSSCSLKAELYTRGQARFESRPQGTSNPSLTGGADLREDGECQPRGAHADTLHQPKPITDGFTHPPPEYVYHPIKPDITYTAYTAPFDSPHPPHSLTMLLKLFAEKLSSETPELYTMLDLSDIICFTTLAAEVYACSEGAWNLSLKNPRDIVPFLRKALGLSLPYHHCCHLWDILFPMLSNSRTQPSLLIQEHGPQEDIPVQIPELFLSPPMKHCLVCSTSSTTVKLQHCSQINGYLDIDGVHLARIYTMKCPKCTTYYRPSYYLSGSDKIHNCYSATDARHKDISQVSCHFFMTHQLAEFFRTRQSLAQ